MGDPLMSDGGVDLDLWVRRRCLCNVGAQECPVHPGHTASKEEKIATRLRWDARVEGGTHECQ